MKRRVSPSVSRRTFLAGVAAIPAVSGVSSTARGAAQSPTRLDVERFIDEVKRARLESDGQKAVEEVLRRTVSNPKAVLQGLGALGGYASGHEEADLSAVARRAAELGAELDFVRRAEAADHVYWAEGRGRGLFLRAAPISVAEAMRERLYGSVDTVVFTSAGAVRLKATRMLNSAVSMRPCR